jgi:hypothetical protein
VVSFAQFSVTLHQGRSMELIVVHVSASAPARAFLSIHRSVLKRTVILNK